MARSAFFTPALMFSKVHRRQRVHEKVTADHAVSQVAFSLTPEKLKDLYVIPIFFVVLTGVSGLAAWLTAWIFRLSRSQRNFAISASPYFSLCPDESMCADKKRQACS